MRSKLDETVEPNIVGIRLSRVAASRRAEEAVANSATALATEEHAELE